MPGVQDLVTLLQMFAGAGGQPAAAAAGLPAMSVGPMSPQFNPPANPPMPPARPLEFGGAMPLSPEAADPSTPATTGTVLARLRGKRASEDDGILSGISSALPGALLAKTNGSKFGAFAQGFAGGMKTSGEERQRVREAETVDAKAARDETFRRDSLNSTNARADASLAATKDWHNASLEETRKNNASLDRYRNAPAVLPTDDPVVRAGKIAGWESEARRSFGLMENNLSKTERAERETNFAKWQSKQPWAQSISAMPPAGSVAPAPAAGAAPAPGVAIPAAPAAPVAVAPPSGAIDALKKNPALREQFDQKFGPGSSQKVLGQ